MPASEVKLSPAESRVLDLIPKDGSRIDHARLQELFWRGRRDKPWNARIIINGYTRELERKTRAMRGDFRVVRSARSGPRPIQVWIERR